MLASAARSRCAAASSEVLDDVELHEHAAQPGDYLALFQECGLLLRACLIHVLGGLGRSGGFEVVEHLLDLIVGEPAQPLGNLFKHLALGGRREALEDQDVDGRAGPTGGLVDARLDLLLLIPLLGGVEILGGGQRDECPHEQCGC